MPVIHNLFAYDTDEVNISESIENPVNHWRHHDVFNYHIFIFFSILFVIIVILCYAEFEGRAFDTRWLHAGTILKTSRISLTNDKPE